MTVAPFDLIGARYDESFTDRAAQLDHGARLIGALPAGARVLDHGCGSGLPTTVQLAEAGLDVVGVDESETMLALARAPGAEFQRRDLRDLTPDLGEFDAVVSFFALLMLPRADIPSVLTGLAGRLRPGGRLALGMVAGDLDAVPILFLGVPVTVTAYPAAELAELVTAAGFVDVELDEVAVDAEEGRVETQQFLHARVR